ncbi:MAG: hypothetical protein UT55_C0087G0011 [Candidatus Peregrinibacteria bacterium GW2011_GWE2_39_6]|nr:MAG: hypothetical protein UT36_C0001G0059 [Candidatus Peregrinibacteria bacterium GW2011_GWF2_39_17]KKR23614.1 MAG: hypothetical protein UT55_C0087G0011 [Candidatus Peregrinibacteria bacterium GW2011_GWE2_39_6]HCW32400.1 hypothetical protein [Candidatus Peregrinibacteria bacterium]
MNISLSWDLVIILFFAIIIAYSFIIGRDATIKNIIAAYIAMLTADGLGNLAQQYLGGEKPILSLLAGTNSEEILIIGKIIFFILVIVIIAVRGGFTVSIERDQGTLMKLLMILLFGTLNAGLIVSTLLLYVSGLSLLGASQIDVANSFAPTSYLVQLMIQNYNLWFSLPAIAFVGVSFWEGRQEEN